MDSTHVYRAIGVKFHYGTILPHTEALQALEPMYPYGLELDFNWHYAGKSDWDKCNCYTRVGFAMTYWDFRSPDILGNALSGLFYVEPFWGLENRVSFSMRAGFGLTYLTHPFNPRTNPKNLSFGTQVAFPLQLGIGTGIWLSPKNLMSVNASLNHISNGGIKDPNTGLNWPTISVGIDHYFETPNFIHREKTDWKELNEQRWRCDIALYSGMKERLPNTYYAVPGMELKGSYQVARISALTLGMEYMYDRALEYDMWDKIKIQSTTNKLSAAVGHEFVMGRVLFSQQFGIYLNSVFESGEDIYQRYGLTYRFCNRWSAGINLKAYFQTAQFIDFRLVYSFVRR